MFNIKEREIILPDSDLPTAVNWVHNDNEIDDIQEDENKEYIDNNKINIAEEEL